MTIHDLSQARKGLPDTDIWPTKCLPKYFSYGRPFRTWTALTALMKMFTASAVKKCQNIAMEIQAHCFYFGFGAGEVFFFIIFTDYF